MVPKIHYRRMILWDADYFLNEPFLMLNLSRSLKTLFKSIFYACV